MLKKLLRLIMTLIGGALGYGAYLFIYRFAPFLAEEEANTQITFAVLLSILFALIFFYLTPFITKQGKRFAHEIEDDLESVAANDILAAVVGLVIGLVIAFLITQIFSAIKNRYLFTVIALVIYLVLGYLGIVIATKKGKELFNQVINARRTQGDGQDGEKNPFKGGSFKVGGKNKKKDKTQGTPKILDTSVIIDGRISEIMKTGFLEGPIVIPEFVLVELRHIADSADDLKRARGRRGLDILNKIQNDYGIEIFNTESEKGLKDIPEVDVKLLKLAQIMNGKVVTNDYNLNKVASINGVDVLNINELANTLKPVVIPGEKMTVTPVKEGKDPNQSIAYLDDGTMVVLEDGRDMIGTTTEINVTSVLQTAAGRMIFGRVKL